MSLNSDPAQAPAAPGGGAASLLEAHKDSASSGRGGSRGARGPYKRKDPSGSAPVAPIPPAQQLFSEENTGRLVALPFTLAAVGSNSDVWRLDPLEQKELAVTGSIALNEWVHADPKWVALCLFSLSIVGVASSKAIAYQGEVRAREIAEEMKKRAAMREAQKNVQSAAGAPGASGAAMVPETGPFAPPSNKQ